MPRLYKTHFKKNGLPLCGHPCWSGVVGFVTEYNKVSCKRCIHILRIKFFSTLGVRYERASKEGGAEG